MESASVTPHEEPEPEYVAVPMSRFPNQPYTHAHDFFLGYIERLSVAARSVDREALQQAATLLRRVFDRGGILYVCGNGGSAAISNHMSCDVLKGVRTDTRIEARIVSLSSQIELITAIANDIEYAEIFVYQLRALAKPCDALLTISSSGNSENVVRALTWARGAGLATIAMTGFAGGRSAALAEVNLHVDCNNYGIVEDTHQSLMHVLAQYLRQSDMPTALIAERTF